MTAWGKTPVRAADTPGFIVNRVNRPFTIEALRMLEAGDAGVVATDDALRGAGFPLGPFELMDLTGIDVTLAAARSIWERLGRPERLRPSPIQERLVAEGHLGRSTGQGFYRYTDGARGPVAPAFASAGSDLGAAAIAAADPRGHRRGGPSCRRRGRRLGVGHRPGAPPRCRAPAGSVRAVAMTTRRRGLS